MLAMISKSLSRVQDGQARELCRGGDDEIRDRWGPVLATVGQQAQHLYSAVLDRSRGTGGAPGG